MRMEITISDIPSTSMSGVSEFMYVENPNPVFDMSWDCMVNYYVKLFENRTNENKRYIHEYASIQDLEEDVYGTLAFKTRAGGLMVTLRKYMIAYQIKINSLIRLMI